MANTWAIKLGRPAWSILRQYILGNRLLWFFVGFGALTTYILWPFYPGEAGVRDEWVGNVAVEGFGFLMDIILFGLLWSVFDVYRERRTKIRGYQDELTDYIPWEAQEGVLRKVGIIKRLNELQAPLPFWLRYICLKGAVLVGADLKGVDLSGANLETACLHAADLKGVHLREANLCLADLSFSNLEGANLLAADLRDANFEGTNLKGARLWNANLEVADLRNANLEGADLRNANLAGADLAWVNLAGDDWEWVNLTGAKNLTWDQLETAKTNDETILPAYLKENAPESYKGKFASEKGE